MKKQHLSVGIVQRIVDEAMEVLLVFDSKRKTWGFIVGDRLEQESFRETILREVAWKFELDRKKDFLVAHMPLLSVETIEATEDSYEETHYKVEFYPIHLYRKQAIREISKKTEFKWFTCREICSGQTDDGTPIDAQLVRWLNKWHVIQPWY